jgi:anti-anti-sigma factor
MKIETRSVYDVLVVDMSGRLDSMSSGDAGDRIVEIARGEHKRVLLNLEKLDYVSSAGLRVILRGAKCCKEIAASSRFATPTAWSGMFLKLPASTV